jgi:putative ABC transport system permease protein
LVGIGILFLPTRDLVISFTGTFLVVIGFAMLTPAVTRFLMGGTSRWIGRIWGVLGRMAPREVVNSLSRTAIAIAALMVAVSVTIGVSLMVGSFRFTVVTWLDQILHGDIYISTPRMGVNQPANSISPQVLEILEGWEGVSRVDLLRSAFVDSPYGPIQISANNNPYDGVEQVYYAVDYPPGEIGQALKKGAVLVSEPLANRLNLPARGGEIELYTNNGLQTFPVAGIYYDYASSQGTVSMWLENYRQLWNDEEITAAALVLEPGVDPDQSAEILRRALAGEQQLLVRPNQALREDTLVIFDRTFEITGALQLMTTIVAFVGVLGALMSLQLDKQRQLGILKAIGLTSKQLWGLIALETGLMGAVAGLLAMPTGYVLAIILIYIINRRSFGWTLQMFVTLDPFLQALMVAVVAALLAGLYPAIRIINRKAADAIRFD